MNGTLRNAVRRAVSQTKLEDQTLALVLPGEQSSPA